MRGWWVAFLRDENGGIHGGVEGVALAEHVEPVAMEDGPHRGLAGEGEEGVRDDEAEAPAVAQEAEAEVGEEDVEIVRVAPALLQRGEPRLAAARLRGDIGRIAEHGVEARRAGRERRTVGGEEDIGELDLPMERREVGAHRVPFFGDGIAELFRLGALARFHGLRRESEAGEGEVIEFGQRQALDRAEPEVGDAEQRSEAGAGFAPHALLLFHQLHAGGGLGFDIHVAADDFTQGGLDNIGELERNEVGAREGRLREFGGAGEEE